MRWQSLRCAAMRELQQTSEGGGREPVRRCRALRNSRHSPPRFEQKLATVADRSDPIDAFSVVSDTGRLDRLLNLSEARSRRFRSRRNAPATIEVEVELQRLILDWLKGRELDELGATYLAAVEDEAIPLRTTQ